MLVASQEARTRAAVLIGYVRWLRANRYYDDVARRVGPELRALMEDPPIRTAWISGRDIEGVMHALEQITTASECRRLGIEVTRDTVLPSIRPILEAALRRTHASPASIFERLDVMLRMVVPDQTAVYRSIDERSGEVVLGWPYTPRGATLEVWAGVLQVGIELCGRSGTVHIAGQPDAHRARFAVSWS